MKYYILLFVLLGLAFSFDANAQNRTDKTTTVVIEKEIQKNGETHMEKQILTGEEAQKYLEENDEIDIDIDIDEIINNETISITADDTGIRKYKIVTRDGDDSDVLEWNGEGEMPEDMKELLDEYEINIEEGEDAKTIIMESRKEGLSPVVRKRIKTNDEVFVFENGGDKFDLKGDPNKARLGVMIEEENGEVIIQEVMEDTPAERAGMAEGDVIVKVDDTEIDNIDRLMAEMGTLRKGQKIDVVIKVNGSKKKTIKVQL